jgi:hypothetical protein
MILSRYLIHVYSYIFKNILFWNTFCVIVCRCIYHVSFWWCLTGLHCACGKWLGEWLMWYCLPHTNFTYKNGLLTYWQYQILIFILFSFLQVSDINKQDPLIHSFLLQKFKFLRTKNNYKKGRISTDIHRAHPRKCWHSVLIWPSCDRASW